MAAQDSRNRPLHPGRTCQHLDVGSAGVPGRFYARCAVGTAEDRERWGRESRPSSAR
jgi:hypothetical protein